MTKKRLMSLIPLLLAAATLTACTGADDAATPTPSEIPTASETPPVSESPTPSVIAAGLDVPWSVAFHDPTALVSERDSARILELDGAGGAREIAVIEGVAPGGEGGLLGIAVHDDLLYAYYTAGDENRIDRFTLTGEPGSLGIGAAERVFDGIPSASNHNGGRIAFGPDGMLYATTGDAGNGQDAQDLKSPAGKILRLTPDGGIPRDNPFPDSPVYSYGHRNAQGITWDADGTLYASEFGQNTWDELNVIEPGGNYGWPEVEGIAEHDGFTDPVQQWAPQDASPSGIVVAGDVILIANLRGARLREVPLDDLTTSTEHLVAEYGRLRDVVLAPDGSTWVVTNNTDGRGDPGPDDDRIIRIAVD
ncbi:sorbosone dehydrogenase family protein [Microbacterium sp. AK031]|uniref:PQQ-dependent sugar dehydrogenase n=1 Tax=Microbacterium sp. AK031 TaxID=2723076 RepID=UPI00216A220D|nr:PQQ-dependent sugar dehydrogenase [Microbacterium sp. AK031]MCS3844302.1 glucose/arabinose dehydrogenase [Microbacterium sp. AK031]